MTKTEDPKSIYNQYSSLKKLLYEEDIQLMQPLEDSLKQKGQMKPPFGKCYFCKGPTHWIGDCPEAKKPRSQSTVATGKKKPSFGQCYNYGSPNHWAPDCPHKNEMDSSSISPSSTLEKQQPSTSTEISTSRKRKLPDTDSSETVPSKKMKTRAGSRKQTSRKQHCFVCKSDSHLAKDCSDIVVDRSEQNDTDEE